MGCDGGVIAVQRKFLRGCGEGKKEKEEVTERERQTVKASTCALTNQRLAQPIVACELGYLYNKEAILNALLERSLNAAFSHIRGLKDLKECKFALNPSPESETQFVCPITMMEFDGVHPFVMIWTTGFVLSEKAVNEVGIEGLQVEYGPFQAQDLVRLIPTAELMEIQTMAMQARRERAKLASKDKKKRKRAEAGAAETKAESKRNSSEEEEEEKGTTEAKPVKAHKSSETIDVAPPQTHSLSYAAVAARKAADAVKKNAKKDSVFHSLFHSSSAQQSSSNDLFIHVAGHRYTLT